MLLRRSRCIVRTLCATSRLLTANSQRAGLRSPTSVGSAKPTGSTTQWATGGTRRTSQCAGVAFARRSPLDTQDTLAADHPKFSAVDLDYDDVFYPFHRRDGAIAASIRHTTTTAKPSCHFTLSISDDDGNGAGLETCV